MSNKSYNIVKIVLLSVLLVFLCGFFILIMVFDEKFDDFVFSSGDKMSKVIENDYSLSSVNGINANLRDADFTIKYADTDQVKVVVYDKEDTKANVSVNDGILDISFTGSYVCFGFCYSNRRVDVYLPDSFSGDIDVTSASGDVNIPQLANSNIKVKTASGDVKINEGNNVEVRTASGEVDIIKANVINVNTVSGDVEIDSVNEITGSTTSGDVEINKVKEVIEFTTVSGEIDIIDCNLIKNSKLSTVSGDVEIERLNSVYVNTKTTSGDVDVRGDDRRSEIELSIKTTSGDIDIN